MVCVIEPDCDLVCEVVSVAVDDWLAEDVPVRVCDNDWLGEPEPLTLCVWLSDWVLVWLAVCVRLLDPVCDAVRLAVDVSDVVCVSDTDFVPVWLPLCV